MVDKAKCFFDRQCQMAVRGIGIGHKVCCVLIHAFHLPNDNMNAEIDILSAHCALTIKYSDMTFNYSLTGQEVQHPRGLTIEVTTYTDGTRKTVKVLK